jgi:hypothetical protein
MCWSKSELLVRSVYQPGSTCMSSENCAVSLWNPQHHHITVASMYVIAFTIGIASNPGYSLVDASIYVNWDVLLFYLGILLMCIEVSLIVLFRASNMLARVNTGDHVVTFDFFFTSLHPTRWLQMYPLPSSTGIRLIVQDTTPNCHAMLDICITNPTVCYTNFHSTVAFHSCLTHLDATLNAWDILNQGGVPLGQFDRCGASCR